MFFSFLPVPQVHHRPMQMRLYRSRFAIGDPGNVLDRHALHGTQEQGLALRSGQLANARGYTFQPLPTEKMLLRRRCRITNFARAFLRGLGIPEANESAPQSKSAIAIVVPD